MNRTTATIITTGLSLALLAGGSSLVAGGSARRHAGSNDGTHARHATHADASPAKAALRNKMRKLWEDHIVWTRMFIVSSVADLPDAGNAAARLLLNQRHIGNAIKPYYGDEAGDSLTALLEDHILIAADLLAAAKEGDDEGVDEASQRWDANAVDIATFLAEANPRHWKRAEMTSMMRDHLELTLGEAVARLNAEWDQDIAFYDRIHRQALHMADMLSRGIIKQFPRRF